MLLPQTLPWCWALLFLAISCSHFFLPQVFYATIGASANVALVLHTAPILFAYSFVAIAGHLGLLLAVGTALGFSRRDLLLASNANIGGEGRGGQRLTWVVGRHSASAARTWSSPRMPNIGRGPGGGNNTSRVRAVTCVAGAPLS